MLLEIELLMTRVHLLVPVFISLLLLSTSDVTRFAVYAEVTTESSSEAQEIHELLQVRMP